MKNSVLMLAAILTFMLVWVAVTGFVTWVGNESFRANMVSNLVIMFMFTFGWIPSLFVCIDIDNEYSV